MSALLTLQQLLPFSLEEASEIDLKPPTSLDALETYTNFVKTKPNASQQLLEKTRIEAANSKETDYSYVSSLSKSDVENLTRKFQNYQNNIKSYRAKLQPLESVLTDFNTELNDLSNTLTSLQEQSSRLTSDLNLQRTLTEKLNPIILDLMIPPDLVRSVIKEPIDERWLENVRFINEKTQLLETVSLQKTTNYEHTKALKELKAGLLLLTAKAVERIRDYIISSIKKLRSSVTTSSQTIQQELLQVKEVFVFLKAHEPQLANQLQLAYIFTMRWYYHTRFAKYLYALEKLHLKHIDQTYVLGSSESGTDDKLGVFGGGFKSWLSSSSQATSYSPTSPNPQQLQPAKVTLNEYLQSIDKRIDILKEKVDPEKTETAIPAQIAETTPFQYWLEFVYNQWSIALIDNIVVEYLFMVEFFYQGSEKFDNVDALNPNSPVKESTSSKPHKNDWSAVMFGEIYKLSYDFVTWLITHQAAYLSSRITSGSSSRTAQAASSYTGTCDAYAILLMIRIIQNTQFSLHNEFRIPVLDDHLNSLLLLLWPQFTKIIDMNCESMKKIIMRSFTSKSKDAHLAPVNITQLFGHFLLGLLKLTFTPDKDENHFKGEPLYTSVSRLKNDFESTLTKMSNHLFSNKSQSTQKEIFLYNNYFLIVNIIKNENGSESSAFIDEQINHFEMLCEAYKTR